MFKELRKELKSLSEEVELSASTGQEVDLDELNEDDEEVEEVSADEQTLEEIVRLFEDEVVEMGAEDAERLMTEDDDEDEEAKDEEGSEELSEGAVERDVKRGEKLGRKAAKFIAKKEKAGNKVKYTVREATIDEVKRLSMKRYIKIYALGTLFAVIYNKVADKKNDVGSKATVVSVEVEDAKGNKKIVVFAAITNLKPADVKSGLDKALAEFRKEAKKAVKEDDEVVGDQEENKLDTLEEAYKFLFEDEDVVGDEEESELDKELQEMISFLEDDEVEAEDEKEEELSEDDEEIQDKEEEAKEALAEAVNALRALRRAKKARR